MKSQTYYQMSRQEMFTKVRSFPLCHTGHEHVPILYLRELEQGRPWKLNSRMQTETEVCLMAVINKELEL